MKTNNPLICNILFDLPFGDSFPSLDLPVPNKESDSLYVASRELTDLLDVTNPVVDGLFRSNDFDLLNDPSVSDKTRSFLLGRTSSIPDDSFSDRNLSDQELASHAIPRGLSFSDVNSFGSSLLDSLESPISSSEPAVSSVEPSVSSAEPPSVPN